MALAGLGVTLQVKVIPQVWENMESGQAKCIRTGGLLFDFVPHANSSNRVLRHSSPLHPSSTPCDSEMELRVHHSAKAQGLDRNLRLSLTAAKLDLMKQLVERSLPAIAGFGSLAPTNLHAAHLAFYKETAGLLITFSGPSGPSPDAIVAGRLLGPMAAEGRIVFQFAQRVSGRGHSGSAFDWANSVSFPLGADDCAAFLTMGSVNADFTRTSTSHGPLEKKMTWTRAPDGHGVVTAISSKGLSLELLLSWAELKVLQVVVRSLIPRMLGLGWL
eukprot:EG_transcript_21431